MVSHEARSPTDYRDPVKMFRTAFPDLTLTEYETIAEDDKVVSRFTFTGIHEEEFMVTEPTGGDHR